MTWNNALTADAGVLASLGSVSPNTWYEVNLTTHITGDATYTLRISDSTGGADYSSKEDANDPKLLVAFGGATPQSCSGAATATPTPGATSTPTPTNTPGPSPTPTNTSAPTATQPPQGAFNSATFVYDGDGKRVKSVFNGTTTTYFVGNHYEVTGSTTIKYYYAGSQRIAMRTNGTLNYLLGDHLGSTSLIIDSAGNKTNEQRYKAWGETRYTFGSEKTKYQYTGQFSYTSDFGLYFYNARWYDPSLGRFAQADILVPLAQGVQAWDRYAYTNNNPLRYTDPSGHCLKEKDYAEGSLCYFKNMSWSERKSWLQNFVQVNDLGAWFNDIEGAINFMESDDYFSQDGSTSEVMDAAVLQAINDGWLIHSGQDSVGGGGEGWADFFDLLQPPDGSPSTATQRELNIARLHAEQVGVDYAYNLPEVQSAISNASTLEQIYFGEFKYWADLYRTLGINGAGVVCPICAGNIDPRETGGLLVEASALLKPWATTKYSWLVSLSPMGAP